MITIINDPAELKYSPLMTLYAEDLCTRAQVDYPNKSHNEALMDAAYQAADNAHPGHVRIGRVATGDQFVAGKELKDKIIANTQGLCTEMEGAAIAQTAYRNKVPFVILRAISDKADNSATMDYPTFEQIAAHRCAEVTRTLARQLQNAK